MMGSADFQQSFLYGYEKIITKKGYIKIILPS